MRLRDFALFGILFLALGSTIQAQTNTNLGNINVTGTGTFSGSLTATAGQNILNAYNVNSMLFVDGVKYTTIASAVTAAGSSPTVIIIPSTYAGTECPASVVSNLTFWDYRVQGTAGPLCSQNSISVNQTSGGFQHSMLRGIMTRTSTPDSDLVMYSQAEYNGNLPNQSIEAAASEVDVIGSVTNNSNAQVIAHEFDAVLNDSSAVHTISYMSGGFVNNTLQTGNQISPSNIYGWYIRPITNNSAVTPANVYGMWIESPASCSTNCFSFVAQGAGRVDKTLTLDNSAGLPLTISTDTTANYGFSIVDTHTGGHQYNCGDGVDGSVGRFECRDLTQAGAPYFGFDTTGQGSGSIALYRSVATASRTYTFPDATGTVPLTGNGTTPLQTKRVASCTTGAAAASTCTTTVSWTTAFADTNYTATCTIENVTAVPYVLFYGTKAAGSIVVTIANLTAVAASGTIDCTAVHD